MSRWSIPSVVLSVVGLAACGGSDPSPVTPAVARTPTPTPTPLPLVVVSGETGQPVGGATVSFSGSRVETGSDGSFSVPAGTTDDTLVDVIAAGFFDRQTTVGRGRAVGRYSLWPRTSPTGLDEQFTRQIVYSASDGSDIPLDRWQPSQGEVRVVLGQGFDRSLGRSVDNHYDAVAEINELFEGPPVYRPPVLSNEQPTAGVVQFRIDPDDRACEDTIVAVTRRFVFESGETARVEVVYCNVSEAQAINNVRHVLGHGLGLRHSGGRSDLMFGFNSAPGFCARPRLVVKLMYQRPAGNSFPDNDREAAGSLAHATAVVGVETTTCR